VQLRTGDADVARRASRADSVHVAEDVGRAAETGGVELLERRQVRVGRDAATDSHPAERRRLHDDHVVALTTARTERLQVTELVICSYTDVGNDNYYCLIITSHSKTTDTQNSFQCLVQDPWDEDIQPSDQPRITGVRL